MKQHLHTASHTSANRPDSFVPAGLFFLVVVGFLLLAASPLAAQGLNDQEAATPGVPAEASPATGASSETALNPLDAERIACFDRLWSGYQEDVWFYGKNGQRIVPEPNLEWLVVRLMAGTRQIDTFPTEAVDDLSPNGADSVAEPPTDIFPPGTSDTYSMGVGNIQLPSFESFNQQYGEYFSHFLHEPDLAPFMAAYRLHRDMPAEVFQALMDRLQQDPRVMYAHPAWKIAHQLYAPLERIEITWKTAAGIRQRQALLQAVGAVEADDVSPSNHQKVTIDPCRQSVWQSANLLAEDIRVAQAWPALMPLVPPVSVRFELAINGAMPGTAIPFTFELRFTDQVKIESSTIANLNLKPAGIFHNLYDIHYDVPLSAVDLNRSPIRITGQMKIYATGEYSIPGIPVYYTDSHAPESRVQLIKTAERPVRIAAMIPETQEGFDLQTGEPGPMPVMDLIATTGAKRRYALLMLFGLALIGLAGAAAAILWRSRRQQAVQPQNNALPRRHAAAIAAVQIVQQHPGLTELAVLGIALKNYLAEFVGLDEDKRGGSHAAFLRRIEAGLPDTCRSSAAEVLSIIDHVLAKGDPAAIPTELSGKAARLIETLRAFTDARPDSAEKH
jgi:hypothetical protein